MNIRLGAARTIVIGPILDSTGAAKTDEVVASVLASKNGGNPTALDGSATLTHKQTGYYLLALTTNDISALGCLEISLNSTTNTMPIVRLNVMTALSWDALYAVSGGGVPLDWAQVANPTATVALTNTSINDVTTKTGYSLSATGLDAIVKFKALLDGTPSSSVVDDNDPDPTTTAFETDLAEVTNDHYNGAFCVFYSGALTGQSRKISDYDGTTKVLTVASAFTEAPAAGDDFLIIGRSE